MANRFKNPMMRERYDGLLREYAARGKALFYPNGSICRGNGIADVFWRGYDGGKMNWDRASKATLEYASWCAGRDVAAQERV